MRWPFRPPHLTLKPSKKTKKEKRHTHKNRKNQKVLKNELFQFVSQIVLFWVGVQDFPFLTTWPKKHAPQKTIKIGVSARHFLKKRYASRNGHFWTKTTQIQKFQLSFSGGFFLLCKPQKHQIMLKPLI